MSMVFAHLSLPKPGERDNGDAVLARQDEDGRAMLAVIDGLGHGPIAAEASRAALSRLQEMSLQTSVLQAMYAVHDALRNTRGACATLCIINQRAVQVCAVGNVQLLSVNCTVPLIVSAGILGQHVSKFRVCEAELKPNARVALLSDGINTRVRLEQLRQLSAADACKVVMEQHRRGDDDATVLVADMGD